MSVGPSRAAEISGRPLVVYVMSSYPYGAGESFVAPEVGWLQREVADVLLVPVRPRGPLRAPEDVPAGVTTRAHRLLTPQIMLSAVQAAARHPLRTISLVLRILRCDGPRVGLRNLALVPKGLWLGRLLGQHRAQHVHAYWASAPATVAMVAGEIAGLPWSFTGHRWELLEPNLLRIKAGSCAFGRITSAEGLRRALDQLPPAAADSLILEYTGVDLPEHVPPFGGVLPLQLLCPALMIERKDHATLVQGFAEAVHDGVDAELLLAGSGPTRSLIEAQVKSLGIESRVRFLGELSHTELLGLYDSGRVDVVVLTSLDEGLPFGLLEPMARGIPVIGTDVGGIAELLNHGGGLLVAAGDSLAAAESIRAISIDADHRRRIGASARVTIEETFDIRVQGRRLARRLFPTDARD